MMMMVTASEAEINCVWLWPALIKVTLSLSLFSYTFLFTSLSATLYARAEGLENQVYGTPNPFTAVTTISKSSTAFQFMCSNKMLCL